MSRRTQNTRFPDAPQTWDTSSRDTWNSLMRALETSRIFDAGRRTLPEFRIIGSVNTALTVNINDGSLDQLRNAVGRILLALNDSNYLETNVLSATVTTPVTTTLAPLLLPEYTVTMLPSVSISGQVVAVTNEVGGYVLAFSDGTNWRRVTDRAIVS